MLNVVDVMLDLETLGTVPGSVVISIGASSTAPEDVSDATSMSREFLCKISIASALHAGLVADPDTLSWWRKQPLKVWQEVTDNGGDLAFVLGEFADWLAALRKGPDSSKTGTKLRLWGDAASFDLTLLACAYRAVHMPVPWHYQEEFCYRTLRTILASEKPRSKVQHDALSDARAQLAHLQEMLKGLSHDQSQENT